MIKLYNSEKISTLHVYSFTVSPAGDVITEQYNKVNAFLLKIKPYASFDVRAELTDVNRRLHYHGTIQFKSYVGVQKTYDVINYYKHDLQIEIDTIQDYWIWYTYCRKSRHMIKPYLRTLPVSYHLTDYNIDELNDCVNIMDQFKKGINNLEYGIRCK